MAINPVRNKDALWAYYCGIFSIIPLLSLFFGPLAVLMGWKGLQKIKTTPNTPGKVHSWIGIFIGSIAFITNMTVLLLLLNWINSIQT